MKNPKTFASLILCGCSMGCSPMVGDEPGSDPISVLGKVERATGRKDVVIMVIPPSKGRVADATAESLGKTLGEASLPRSVRKGLKRTKEEGLRAYVGGNSAWKVEWTLREALANSPAGSLQGLIIYTNTAITSSLEEAARHAGAALSKLD